MTHTFVYVQVQSVCSWSTCFDLSRLLYSHFHSKMLRSLQTSKNSTSTLSCLLVPAVAMIKGKSQWHTHTHTLSSFPLGFSAIFFFFFMSLTHTWLLRCGSHCIIGALVSLLVRLSSLYPLAATQTQFRLVAPRQMFLLLSFIFPN